MAKIQLSDRAVSYLGILTIVLCLCEAIALIVAFGFPDFTCAHVPALAPWAENFLWLAFLNAGFTLGNWIRDSDIRYTKLPDTELPIKGSDEESLRERADLESAFGRYDRLLLAAVVGRLRPTEMAFSRSTIMARKTPSSFNDGQRRCHGPESFAMRTMSQLAHSLKVKSPPEVNTILKQRRPVKQS
ncbi:hypothetical protein KC315_g16445 [Hortaea werneckii]|nr:hypothetical protein KC315_g16445 [Hortaea werneckii]